MLIERQYIFVKQLQDSLENVEDQIYPKHCKIYYFQGKCGTVENFNFELHFALMYATNRLL